VGLAAGRARAARAEIDRLLEQTEALGHARLRLRAAETAARAALATGDPRQAEAAARTGLDVAASSGGYLDAYRLHQLLARALEETGRTAEAAAERGRAAAEIARVGRGLRPEQQRAFQNIAEVWDLVDRNQSGQPAARQAGRSGRHDGR